MSVTTRDLLVQACDRNPGALETLLSVYEAQGDEIRPILIRFVQGSVKGSVIWMHAKQGCKGDRDVIWKDYIEWLKVSMQDPWSFAAFVSKTYPELAEEIEIIEAEDASDGQ